MAWKRSPVRSRPGPPTLSTSYTGRVLAGMTFVSWFGLRYAYGEGVKERLNVYLKSRRWWSFWSTTLCESCGMPRQFSPDGHQLLLWLDSPAQQRIDIVDLASRKITPIVSSTKPLMAPNFSADGRWILD